MLQVNVIPIVAVITPYESDRKLVREIVGEDNLEMIHVQCPIEICEKRDVKGLYQKARNGQLENFTGISDIFEIPEISVLKINTNSLTIKESLNKFFNKTSMYEIQ